MKNYKILYRLACLTCIALALTLSIPASAAQTATVATGKTATFSVTASGTAPFTYQWQKDGVPIVGQTNATLTLPALTASSAGIYTVVVSNAAGFTVSDNGTLIIISAPTNGIITITIT